MLVGSVLVGSVLVGSVLAGSVLESDTVLSLDRPYGSPRRTMPQQWCGADPPGRPGSPVPGRPGPSGLDRSVPVTDGRGFQVGALADVEARQ